MDIVVDENIETSMSTDHELELAVQNDEIKEKPIKKSSDLNDESINFSNQTLNIKEKLYYNKNFDFEPRFEEIVSMILIKFKTSSS